MSTLKLILFLLSLLYIGLKLSEIAEIAEKIASLQIPSSINVVAKNFDSGSLNDIDRPIDLSEILVVWYIQNRNIQEPRRVFARKISELGDQLSQSCTSEDQKKKVKAAFTRMAKDVDVYFDPEALC